MIKQVIRVEDKWKVIVYYNVDYNLFHIIERDLNNIKVSKKLINRVYRKLKTRQAKAATITNPLIPISIVLFNTHTNKYDYINSIVHEAEHVKQNMLEYYEIEDANEPPAYTIGYLVSRLMLVLDMII